LGHKEVRFLFPALPLFNTAAAAGLARLDRVAWPLKETTVPGRWWLVRLLFLAALVLLVLSWGVSTAFVAVSRQNYPGGVALAQLASLTKTTSTTTDAVVVVYIDNAAAMTGVSLFGQRALGPHTRVVKAGYEASNADALLSDQATWTHVITESADWLTSGDDFRWVATIPGNPRLDWRRTRIVTTDALYILQRR
jgi:alpha-1,6-mannosyltransferase